MPELAIVEILRAFNVQNPCRKRRWNGLTLQSHRWELYPEQILDITTGEFRQSEVLRCDVCRVWFDPSATQNRADTELEPARC